MSVAVLYGSPKTPNPPRRRRRRDDDLTWSCEYCGRLNPVGVYSCIGCGAGRMKEAGAEAEAKTVTVDLSGLWGGDVISDVSAFTRDLVRELHSGAGNYAKPGGFLIPPDYLRPKPTKPEPTLAGRVWGWLTTYKGVW